MLDSHSAAEAPPHALISAATRGPTSDAELLAAYQCSGAEEDFAAIVARHAPAVRAACFQVLRDAHAAEDAAQQTFLVLIQKARTLPAGTNLGGWLRLTSVLVCRQMRRNRRRGEQREQTVSALKESAAGCSPDEQRRERLNAEIQDALKQLPEAQREALVLRYCRGLSEDKAAQASGCGVATFHARVTRGMTELRAKLQRKGYRLSVLALLALEQERASAPRVLGPARGAKVFGVAKPLQVVGAVLVVALFVGALVGLRSSATAQVAPARTTQRAHVTAASAVVDFPDGQHLNDPSLWIPMGELPLHVSATALQVDATNADAGWRWGGLVHHRVWDLREGPVLVRYKARRSLDESRVGAVVMAAGQDFQSPQNTTEQEQFIARLREQFCMKPAGEVAAMPPAQRYVDDTYSVYETLYTPDAFYSRCDGGSWSMIRQQQRAVAVMFFIGAGARRVVSGPALDISDVRIGHAALPAEAATVAPSDPTFRPLIGSGLFGKNLDKPEFWGFANHPHATELTAEQLTLSLRATPGLPQATTRSTAFGLRNTLRTTVGCTYLGLTVTSPDDAAWAKVLSFQVIARLYPKTEERPPYTLQLDGETQLNVIGDLLQGTFTTTAYTPEHSTPVEAYVPLAGSVTVRRPAAHSHRLEVAVTPTELWTRVDGKTIFRGRHGCSAEAVSFGWRLMTRNADRPGDAPDGVTVSDVVVRQSATLDLSDAQPEF